MSHKFCQRLGFGVGNGFGVGFWFCRFGPLIDRVLFGHKICEKFLIF